jgi:general secretion pathway protein D
VLVQAIIVEVSADRSSELGVNWVLDASSTGVGAGTFISPVGGTQNNGVSIVDLYNTAKGTSTTVPLGTTFALGRLSATGINFAAMIRALQGDSRTNIIGQPQITTQDNQEAKIEVAQEVPFITGQYTNTTGTSSAFQTIQRQEVGTILTVTPQINTGDSVLLKIEVESSSLAASSAGAVDLITNKRTFSTNVLIPDGGTLVLGGLIQEKVTNSEQRVPLLGRIPILGELFRTRSTQKTKTNLMVFIQPKILRDDQAGIMETNAKYDYMRNEQKDTNRESTIIPAQPYYKTPLLPDLPQGNDKGNDKGNNKAPAPASDKSDIKPLKKDDIPDTGTQNPANPP